ncbi:hypothetical protein PAXINDRAFT_92856 [Paxillus involutus ATCC 200175]|uniref:Uncharacterized protein n=1 Tax=Paxillus involutus ATCC 200175 TaxID=664439 RepID=A0A0C9TF14_PAXIN|nr:hypothetical protein PAXINDRAFT_92856 [Paxillus involutus ATCC 200175]
MIHLVYRINWLKAKARYCRWQEELALVKHEIDWSIRWFNHQQLQWMERAGVFEAESQQAYAKRKIRVYEHFAEGARESFIEKVTAV